MSHATPHPQQHPQYPPFQQPPAPAARNGLGVAALVLGIIGVLSGLIPILFALAGLLGLLALIFGLVGRSRAKRGQSTNGGVALTGTVLGVASLALAVFGAYTTFKAVDDVVDELNKAGSEISASAEKDAGASGKDKADKDAAAAEGTEEKPTGEALEAGDAVVYDDDLTVTVTDPTEYTPSEYAAGHTKGNQAYKVTVVIENAGKEKFDASLVTAEARAGEDGVEAEAIFDDKVGEMFSGTILPGKKVTVQLAFDAPADAKNLTVEVTPGFDYDATVWDIKV
ncbi:DUF4190 domain-containing protein [Streptomyces sp. NPDC060194]|uniref:DUF4190 domain-containing protein n=1 Tax=Streptomyces sp. NPDC060194 TaxID=3347069 RepID=UPI00365E3407